MSVSEERSFFLVVFLFKRMWAQLGRCFCKNSHTYISINREALSSFSSSHPRDAQILSSDKIQLAEKRKKQLVYLITRDGVLVYLAVWPYVLFQLWVLLYIIRKCSLIIQTATICC